MTPGMLCMAGTTVGGGVRVVMGVRVVSEEGVMVKLVFIQGVQ